MARKKDKAVAKAKAGGNLPAAMMDQMEEAAGQGFENTSMDDYAVPFLNILQKGSPQVDEDDDAYVKGAKPGMFINSVTNELFGKSIDVIPVGYIRQFVEWLPNRGGFVKAHDDFTIINQTEQKETDNGGRIDVLPNGNIVQDTRLHYVLIVDNLQAGPIILSLTSTGIKHSRKWMTSMGNLLLPESTLQAPMHSSTYTLSLLRNENDKGVWYQIGSGSNTAIERNTWVDDKQWEAAAAAKNLLGAGDVKADFDSTIDPQTHTSNNDNGDESDF